MNNQSSYNYLQENEDNIDIENNQQNIEENVCQICYEDKPLRVLFCGHEMCADCIKSIQFVKGRKTCPFCRDTFVQRRTIIVERQAPNNYICTMTYNDCKKLFRFLICMCASIFIIIYLKI
jgi:hypothetical protein